MKIYLMNEPGAPALGVCQKIRGRRQRRCHKDATTVIEYTVPRERWTDELRENGAYVVRMRQIYHEPHRWSACAAHAKRAQRHGAKAVVKVR